jgi:16S rRNA (cytidine1402-2'-O)-methyltransferase
VTSVPGASAVLAALTASGLPTDRFFFEGFLPPRAAARRERIDELAKVPGSLVFFETGPRIAAMLGDLADRLGDRPAAVCRELTKLHEEIRRGDVAALATAYRDGAEMRGEFVVVVGPPVRGEPDQAVDLDGLLKQALASASLKDAVEAVAAATGQKRRTVYQRALALPRRGDDESK